ncbi:ABC transporter ATP-binding protein [Cohaesibacter gelatinilyticus]|uniref:Carbohydrate ABC transporter ATP-binding protein, CUT1 family n=1 Tax=Cohaesibacter gelatinilyticus TaxID=372072 RepID=A0A285PI28_9HYPH|nr:sn-glycerol-3-phosphate ABC transporter ATP-binding protein UgpC [Cohaesibacter gelatinilyticus]SNZ19521.1 carbohydrate ABC transporter ATP-binding protein, CUT1 family [Cohaesibacter gelatinilyticus]
MASLTIDNLHKSYGNVDVLKGIDIEIEDGGFLVLVGPSGCGKSTLLNTIAGLEDITDGDIRIGKQSVSGLAPSKRDIAMVFQSYALYPNMTVAENISFGMEVRGVAKAERNAAIERVADILQIGQLLDRKPAQLSGGQRQRVAMGRALVRDPQVFLFDEPLSNLDAKLRVDMRTEIKRLHQRMGTTIVYVTHDQIEALTLASKIAVLKDGLLQQFGTPAEIYDNPVNMFVADFMGSPSMNLLEATIVASDDGLAASLATGTTAPVLLPIDKQENISGYLGKSVILGIRPEALTDPSGADQASEQIIERECLIDVVEPAGSDTFAVLQLGGKQAIARLRANAKVQTGQTTSLAFDMAKVVFFDPDTTNRIL